MTTTVLPRAPESRALEPSGIRSSVLLVLAGWLSLVIALGAAGVFVGRPGAPPIAIGIGVGAPLLLFFAWLRLSPAFRDFILSLDLRLVAAMQAWRWAGLGFLFLYAYKVLPGVFALPAGLGDMAIGITAPWIMLALIREPRFTGSAAFVRWNLLGILDLVVAISLGVVVAMLRAGTPGEISSAPMATLPLLLVPAYLVPLFLMLHAAALMQSRRAG